MKSIKQFSFIGLAIMLVLNSCTMEKRVYMSGYHIEWNKSKQNPDRKELASNDNGKQAEQNQIGTVEQSETATNTVDNSFTPTANDDNITASVDNNSVIIPSHKTIVFNIKENSITQTTPALEIKSIIKKREMKISKHAPPGINFPVWAYILIAILLPPLAVILKYGSGAAFWYCLLFTLLGYLPGLVYALVYLALRGNKAE